MLGSIFNHKHLPIALDLGSARVRMLQLERAGDGWRVVSAGVEDLPAGLPPTGPERQAATIEKVRALLAAGSYRGRQCVVSLPESIVHYKNVRLPKMPADDLARAVTFEARDRFDLGDAEATVQHLVAGEVLQGQEQRQEIIAMAVTDEAMKGCLTVLDACGLTPIAMEVSPIALARCAARTAESSGPATAEPGAETDDAVGVLIDVGYEAAKVIITRGSQITFYKRIEIGGRTLNEAVARQLELPPEEASRLRLRHAAASAEPAGGDEQLFGSTRRQNVDRALFDATRPQVQELAKEIALCLRYYAVTFRGKRPDRVTLSGGEAGDEQLRSIIAEQLDLPVSTAVPLDGIDAVDCAAVSRCPAGWSVAVGLALRHPFAVHGIKRGAA